jgi:hypothetical protein
MQLDWYFDLHICYQRKMITKYYHTKGFTNNRNTRILLNKYDTPI